MEQALPDITSFIGNGTHLSSVSSEWRDIINENNHHITEGLFNLYQSAETIHEVLQEAFIQNDIESIRKMIIDYKGFAPISWYRLIPYVRSVEAGKLLMKKITQDTDITALKDKIDILTDINNINTLRDMNDVRLFARSNQMHRITDLPKIARDKVADIVLYSLTQWQYKQDLHYANSLQQKDTLLLLDDLAILQWLDSNGYLEMPNTQYLKDILASIQSIIDRRQMNIVPTDPIAFNSFLMRAAFNGRLDILDKYATKDNIINLIVMSFDEDSSRIPPWMYQFLAYKGQQWGQPIDAWVANIVDNHRTTRTPPSDFWKKILATAAGYTTRSEPAHNLARKIINKYRDQLTTQMKQRIYDLSEKMINIR